MPEGPTIAVLSMSFGESYFGGVMDGLARSLAAVGGRLVAIQTLEAGAFSVNLSIPPTFRVPVAWDHIAGFVVILNAVNRDYLEAVRATGRPVVTIADNVPGFDCPLVMPDNRGGVRDAVAHLVEHGHSRIAFVGHTVWRDVAERYEGYKEGLAAAGLDLDPALVYDPGNLHEDGGERAARAMIAAGLPSTAVLTSNDLNAYGLMRTLAAAGYDLPTDQAVIGFDDHEDAPFQTPGLTSIRQPLTAIGRAAADLLLRQIAGETVPAGTYLESTALVVRQSCGCPSRLSASVTVVGDLVPAVLDRRTLVRCLERLVTASGGLEQVQWRETLGQSVDALDEALQSAVRGGVSPHFTHVQRSLAALPALLSDPEMLVEALRYIRQYARHRYGTVDAGDLGPVRRVEDCLQEITLYLSRVQAQAHFHRAVSLESTLDTLYTISKNLLRSHEHDPGSLSWLRRTEMRAGCVGLWADGASGEHPPEQPADRDLTCAVIFDHDRGDVPGPSGRLPVRAFPPRDVVELADLGADQMLFIAGLKVDTRDWGMVALVGPIDAAVSTGREAMNQWAALLAVALEREAVLDALREQEERLRRAALFDELTGLPNRRLFYDRLTAAMRRHHECPDRPYAVLLLDLDGFKQVNDRLGHLAGDQLLTQAAARISAHLPSTDTAARLGGDEFAVLVDRVIDVAEAAALADRLDAALRAPYDLGGQQAVVSASIGIALGDPGQATIEEVVHRADVAMYAAKSRSRERRAADAPSAPGAGTPAAHPVPHPRRLGLRRP